MARIKQELQTQVDPLLEIEEQLSLRLEPVQPDPEFVRRVRYKLINPPTVMLENRRDFSWIFSVFVVLACGITVLWIICRIRHWILR